MNGYAHVRLPVTVASVSVNKTLLSCKPLPCSPAAETAIRPLIWSFESRLPHPSSYPEECFLHRHRYHSGSANLPTKILDFRGLHASVISNLRGGIPQAHREFPGKFESSNLIRGNVREFGRFPLCQAEDLPRDEDEDGIQHLSLSLSLYIYIYIYAQWDIHLSLSLCIYIYIYICIHHIYTYIHRSTRFDAAWEGSTG